MPKSHVNNRSTKHSKLRRGGYHPIMPTSGVEMERHHRTAVGLEQIFGNA